MAMGTLRYAHINVCPLMPRFVCFHAHAFRLQTQEVRTAAFYPPHILCSAGVDGQVCMWSLDTGKHLGVLYQAPPRPPPPTATPMHARKALEALEHDATLSLGIHDEVPAINVLAFCKTLDGLIAAGEDDDLLCVARVVVGAPSVVISRMCGVRGGALAYWIQSRAR